MNTKFRVGDLVRIKALPGISMATLFHGKTGIIAKVPIDNNISYEVYIDDRTLWLIPTELELVKSNV